MDVVDLDELAPDEPGGRGAAPRPWARFRLPNARQLAAVAGVVALVAATVGAVSASHSPLKVEATGMRDGPRVGWSSPSGITAIADIGKGRIATTDGMTVLAARADDGRVLWKVDRAVLGIATVTTVRDLVGTPWVVVGDDQGNVSGSEALIERDSGTFAGRIEMPDAVTTGDGYYVAPMLVSTENGVLLRLAATPEGDGTEVVRLRSPRSDDVMWRVELPASPDDLQIGNAAAIERAGYLLIGSLDEEWPGRFAAAVRVEDGMPAEWLRANQHFDVYGDVAVTVDDEGLVGYDIGSGARLWRRPGSGVMAPSDEVLVERSEDVMRLLEPRTGRELWTAPVLDAWGAVTRWGDTLVAYGGGGVPWTDEEVPGGNVVASFDIRTGEERWRADLGDVVVDVFRGNDQLVALRYHYTNFDESDPDEEIGVSHIEFRSGLVALDPDSGHVRWSQGMTPDRWISRVGRYMVESDWGTLRVLR
ncbi:MAG: PQQ-binding-like beta-propeller repeat protein [Arachnia sp.]